MDHIWDFFAGDFQGLVTEIIESSVCSYEQQDIMIPRSHVYTEDSHEEKAIRNLAKEGLNSKAVRTLDTNPPAPATGNIQPAASPTPTTVRASHINNP